MHITVNHILQHMNKSMLPECVEHGRGTYATTITRIFQIINYEIIYDFERPQLQVHNIQFP